MDWFEYLEQVTAGIRLNAEAAAVRRELLAHLDLLATDLEAAGASKDEAWAEAMRRLGEVAALQDALTQVHSPRVVRPTLAAVAAGLLVASALGTLWEWGLLAGVALGATIVFFATRPHGTTRWHRLRRFGARAAREVPAVVAAALLGVGAALAPLWIEAGRSWALASNPQSPWFGFLPQLAEWRLVLLVVALPAAGAVLLLALRRGRLDAWLSAVLTTAFAVGALVAGAGAGALWGFHMVSAPIAWLWLNTLPPGFFLSKYLWDFLGRVAIEILIFGTAASLAPTVTGWWRSAAGNPLHQGGQRGMA